MTQSDQESINRLVKSAAKQRLDSSLAVRLIAKLSNNSAAWWQLAQLAGDNTGMWEFAYKMAGHIPPKYVDERISIIPKKGQVEEPGFLQPTVPAMKNFTDRLIYIYSESRGTFWTGVIDELLKKHRALFTPQEQRLLNTLIKVPCT